MIAVLTASSAVGVTTWQDVVVQLLNVVQVVLLAVLSRVVYRQGGDITAIRERASQRRATDDPPGTP